MMLMKGNNRIVLNPATVNAIVTSWYNTHAHMEEGKSVVLEFNRHDDNMFTFSIKESEYEDQRNS